MRKKEEDKIAFISYFIIMHLILFCISRRSFSFSFSVVDHYSRSLWLPSLSIKCRYQVPV